MMKKLMFLFTAIVLLLSACSKEEADTSNFIKVDGRKHVVKSALLMSAIKNSLSLSIYDDEDENKQGIVSFMVYLPLSELGETHTLKKPTTIYEMSPVILRFKNSDGSHYDAAAVSNGTISVTAIDEAKDQYEIKALLTFATGLEVEIYYNGSFRDISSNSYD